MSIHFGTDGWRGRIADTYTFAALRRVSQGYASYLKSLGDAGKGIVVGYDNRFLGRDFAHTVAEVMAGNGVRVLLVREPTPTPVIAFAILHYGAGGAVNVTASHNPPEDSGFKIRASYGGAVAAEDLAAVEANIPADESGVTAIPFAEAEAQGMIEWIDPRAPFIEQLGKMVDVEAIKQSGFKVVVDAMWGVGAGWFPETLADGTVEIHEVNNHRNPAFPGMERPEPIPPNIRACQEAVVALGADVGILTDGDADRVGIVAEDGSFVNQLEVYALLAYYLMEVRGQRGAIVKTLSTTSMLEKLGALYGVEVHETGVGFKYVAPKMVETDAMIGGEESGGYAFKGHVPERDGILAGLMFLDLMSRTGRKPTELLADLFAKVGEHHYDRVDVHYPAAERAAILQRVKEAEPTELAGFPVTRINRMDGWKYELGGTGGWLLIRFSGTEPVIRVYTETGDAANVQPLLQAGLDLAGVRR